MVLKLWRILFIITKNFFSDSIILIFNEAITSVFRFNLTTRQFTSLSEKLRKISFTDITRKITNINCRLL